MTGAFSALVAAGCGGGSSGGGTGGSPGNRDAAPIKADGPVVGPDTLVTGPDTPVPGPDSGPDVAVFGPEAGPDLTIRFDSAAGGVGGSVDVGGTGGIGGIDAAGAGGAPVDARINGTEAGPIDTSSRPLVCPPLATHDSNYPATTGLTNIAWDTDGTLVTGTTGYVGNAFAGKTWNRGGSADIVVAKLYPDDLTPGDGLALTAKWVFGVGDTKDQLVTGVGVASTGVGVVGQFLGTISLDPDQIIPIQDITNNQSTKVDYILGLKDSDGTGVWSKKVNLQGGQLLAIAANPTKNYFIVCGAAMNTAANLATTSLTGIAGTPGGGKDVVAAAIDASSGKVKWAKLFGGAGDQSCTSAALDDSGSVVLAGTFAGALDFGLGALTPPAEAVDGGSSVAPQVLWVAKLDGSTGTVVSAKSFGTSGNVTPSGLAIDGQGNVIVAGWFNAPFVFGSQTVTPGSPSPGTDGLALKLDGSFTPGWARRWGGTVATNSGVDVDSAGRITVVGAFRVSVDVGPANTVLMSHANNPGSYESVVVTLDGSSGQTLCAQNYGDANETGGLAAAVAINRRASGTSQDRTAIAGSFNNVISFGGQTTTLAMPAGTSTTNLASYLVEF